MTLLHNDSEVTNAFIPLLQNAVDYTVQKIWNENREIIRIIVYEAGRPERYNRTNLFRDAWTVGSKDKSTGSKEAYGRFYYDPQVMNVGSINPDSENWGQHISIVNGKDVREYLADIIYQGKVGSAVGDMTDYYHQKRDAWSALMKVVGKGKIAQWFEEGMKQTGLQYKKYVTVGIKETKE